jgi:DNA-binding response OmpR family regulator
VLIAEDDEAVADFSHKGLEAKQHAVDIAQGGDEA